MPEELIPSSIPKNILSQVEILRRNPNIEGERRGSLLTFLVDQLIKLERERIKKPLLPWPSPYSLFTKFYENDRKKKKDIGRAGQRLAIQLRTALDELYERPSLPTGITHRITISSARGRAYQPEFLEVTPQETATTASISGRPLPDDPYVWYVGNNLDALQYVTKKIEEGQLQRIEETFIRLVDRQTIYNGKIFDAFCDAVKKSDLAYRAILGSTLDTAIYRPGGLRDAFADRGAKKSAKFFRLKHGTPLLNFTLLYSKDPRTSRTKNIEVLFGYTVHGPDEDVSKTAVFASHDERLRDEFYHLFRALRRHSHEIAIERPHLFRQSFHQSDVLGTFKEFPARKILKAISACGRETPTDERREEGARKRIHGIGKPRIKICVSAMHFLDSGAFTTALMNALKREGVRVSIALWHPDSDFLKLRQQVISNVKSGFVAQEITGNIATLQPFTNYDNLRFYLCTVPVASVSLFWIDDLIFFSPYWVGQTVTTGPHFVVAASSVTGKALQLQYKQMLIGAVRQKGSLPIS